MKRPVKRPPALIVERPAHGADAVKLISAGPTTSTTAAAVESATATALRMRAALRGSAAPSLRPEQRSSGGFELHAVVVVESQRSGSPTTTGRSASSQGGGTLSPLLVDSPPGSAVGRRRTARSSPTTQSRSRSLSQKSSVHLMVHDFSSSCCSPSVASSSCAEGGGGAAALAGQHCCLWVTDSPPATPGADRGADGDEASATGTSPPLPRWRGRSCGRERDSQAFAQAPEELAFPEHRPPSGLAGRPPLPGDDPCGGLPFGEHAALADGAARALATSSPSWPLVEFAGRGQQGRCGEPWRSGPEEVASGLCLS